VTETLSKSKRNHYRSLYGKKYRLRHGESIVEGLRSVKACLDSDVVIKDLVVTESHASHFPKSIISEKIGGQYLQIGKKEMNSISGVDNSPGILATFVIPENRSADSFSASRIILFDAVQDPGNLGALLRSAAWFGFTEVLLGPGCVDPFSPKVIRASMGGIWELSFSSSRDLSSDLSLFQSKDYKVVSADMAGTNLSEFEAPKELVLILGNEANGVSEGILSVSDHIVSVPKVTKGVNPESLNVSAAGAIIMSRLAET